MALVSGAAGRPGGWTKPGSGCIVITMELVVVRE